MQYKRIFVEIKLLNSLIFSGICFVNTFNYNKSSSKTNKNIYVPKVVSYRSASCDCCRKWINHLRDNGLEVVDNLVENISEIKNQYQIPNNLRSCHSSKIGDYSIEEHVRIDSIKKVLKDIPLISGLALPGMPLGFQGMEIYSYDLYSRNYQNYEVVIY